MKKGIAKMGNRISTWFLTMAMVVGLVAVPAEEVKAAEVTGAAARDSNSPVYVEFPLDSANSTATYNQYEVKLHNNSGDTICDWTIKIQFSGDPGWNDGWNGAKDGYDSSTQMLTIKTYGEASWNNATIYNGQIGSGAGFQVRAGALENATVTITYSIGESQKGPATGNTGGGGSSGGNSGGAQGDTTTNKNLDVEYNFAKLLQYSLYFYDANMCGDLEGKSLVSWRKNCHPQDKKATYNGKTVDVSGGFHDAGDHDKFGLPQAYSASILGIGYYEYKEAYEKTGQVSHFNTILNHFCDYFVRCTVLDNSGNAIAFCYQVGDGRDHSEWLAAEQETNMERPAYFADSNTPATDQVSEAAAALAIHYLNFKGTQYENKTYLEYAKKLFAMEQALGDKKATQNSQGGDFYTSRTWEDDYCLAAAWLYKATGETNYLNEYNQYKESANLYSWPSWDDVGAYALAYGPNGDYSPLAENATSNINASQKISNGYVYLAQWGSARYNCNMQLEGLIYDKNTNQDKYTTWANGQMKFLLGNSDDKRCYVVGYNENSSKYPHHRTASGYAGMPDTGYQTTVQAHVLTGALVGGIESADGTYHDSSADYTCNEVAIDYNAAFTGAAAALYLENENDGSQMLDTDYVIDGTATCPANKGGSAKNPSQKISVKKITLTPNAVTLKAGETKQVTCTVEPVNAFNPNVTWSSSNETVATISSSGLVTAVSEGTAKVVATAQDGSNVKGEAVITVENAAPGGTGDGADSSDSAKVQATSLTLTASVKGANNIPVGKTIKLAPKKKLTLKVAEFLPEGAGSEGVTFTSSKPTVAKVDSSGKITAGKKAGKTTITVTTASGGASKTITVQVMKKAVSKVTIKTSKTTIQVKKNVNLKVTITPNKKNASNNVFWKSSNTKVATVSSKGVVKGVKKGKAKITAVATDGSGKKATVTIQVK